MKKLPLDGVRVLDLTMMWAGPYATRMIGEMGAEVIKIESPKAWDNIRTLMPRTEVVEDPWNSAFYFAEYNHNKKSVTLDLAVEAGRDAFLKLVAKAHPRVELHVICDNYATHKHDNIQRWLAKNPRVTLHFTPTSCSWLNMVEIFFGIITRQAIHRGTFTDRRSTRNRDPRLDRQLQRTRQTVHMDQNRRRATRQNQT